MTLGEGGKIRLQLWSLSFWPFLSPLLPSIPLCSPAVTRHSPAHLTISNWCLKSAFIYIKFDVILGTSIWKSHFPYVIVVFVRNLMCNTRNIAVLSCVHKLLVLPIIVIVCLSFDFTPRSPLLLWTLRTVITWVTAGNNPRPPWTKPYPHQDYVKLKSFLYNILYLCFLFYFHIFFSHVVKENLYRFRFDFCLSFFILKTLTSAPPMLLFLFVSCGLIGIALKCDVRKRNTNSIPSSRGSVGENLVSTVRLKYLWFRSRQEYTTQVTILRVKPTTQHYS